MIDLSVVVLSYNTKKLTLACLESLTKSRMGNRFKVWVVDNASTDGSPQAVTDRFPEVRLLKSDKNLGFSGGNNLGLKETGSFSNYTLLLNSDTLVKPDFIGSLLKVAGQSDYSILSCKLVGPDGKLQPNAGTLPGIGALFVWLSGIDDLLRKYIRISSYQERKESYYMGTKTVGWVSGSVMLIKSECLSKIGLLDDKIFMYGEDVDYCWRAWKKGLKVGWTDQCEVIHLGGGSSKNPRFAQWLGEFKGLVYLYRKHYGQLCSDILKFNIRIFVLIRVVIFFILNRKETSKIYGRIIKKI